MSVDVLEDGGPWVCPECGVASAPAEWPEAEVYCEDCGDHGARKCPSCGACFDDVMEDWTPGLAQVRAATAKARGVVELAATEGAADPLSMFAEPFPGLPGPDRRRIS